MSLYDNIPEELTSLNQWVCWKVEKGTKVPKVASGKCMRNASSKDSKTWKPYKAAVLAVERGHADGIGFVFSDDDDYIGIDYDNKQNDQTIESNHQIWINNFNSYTELSPSGLGYHTILKGKAIKGFNQSPYEAYSSGRYFTFTGNVVLDRPIIENKRALSEFLDTYASPEREKFELPEVVIEGNRNDTLFRLACSLLTRRVPVEDTITLIKGFNRGLKKPLKEGEVTKILESAGGYDYEDDDFDIFPWLVENLVFIAAQDAYWDWSQCGVLKRTAINEAYIKHMPENDKGVKPTPSNWLRKQKDMRTVYDLGWHPGKEEIYNWVGQTRINTYQSGDVKPKKKNVKPWLDHLKWLVSDEDVYEAVLDWLAYTVQFPGEKINYGLFIGGPERIGKDMMMLPVKQILGLHNCKEISAPELEGDYNEYLWQTKLLTIGEMHTNIATARKVENKLKQMLTDPPYDLAINIKHTRRFTVPNIVSVVFFSNHRDALTITGGNAARYLCWWCDVAPKSPSYYATLYDWLRNNADGIYQHLLDRDLSNFNPKGNAPSNKFTEEIVNMSKDPLQADIEERIATLEYPFHVDLVTVADIIEGMELGQNQRIKIAKILKQLGYNQLRAQKRGHSPKTFYVVRRFDTYKDLMSNKLYDLHLTQHPRKRKIS